MAKDMGYWEPHTKRVNIKYNVIYLSNCLGETNNLVNADYDASTLPPGKNSVMGLGRVEPSSFKSLDSGLQVPMGPAKNDSKKQGNTLNYNEFIVYDTKQIKMKYLAKIKFDFKY